MRREFQLVWIGLAVTGAMAVTSASASAATRIYCSVPSLGHDVGVFKISPRVCTIGYYGPEVFTVAGHPFPIAVSKLSWRSWGGPVATGRGSTIDGQGTTFRVTLRVSGRFKCGNDRVYSRVRIQGARYTGTLAGMPTPDVDRCRPRSMLP